MRNANNAMIIDPIAEARRYVTNAHEVLRSNGKLDPETNRYEDPKYVRAAGHYLWSGALIALESVFHAKTEKKKRKGKDARVDIDDYLVVVNQRDQKLLRLVIDAYNITHLSMGYDGIQIKTICDDGFRIVNAIIDRCEKMTPSVAA